MSPPHASHSGTGAASGQSGAGDVDRLPRRQVLLSLLCVSLALFLSSVSQTIVATALPVIVADLGGFDRYGWIATAYILASTIAIPIAGRLSDIHGRKPFLVLGLIVFALGSILAGSSQTMNQLVASRIVQGVGGGILLTGSYAAIADLFPPEERGRYHGLASVAYALAVILGPILGGVIATHLSWHWVFLLNVPVSVLVLALIVRIFPRLPPKTGDRTLDYPGMVTLVLALGPLFLALSLGGVTYAWDSAHIAGLALFGLTMAGAFVVIEMKAPSPIMPLTMYRDRAVAPAVTVAFLAGFGLFGSVLFLPLFIQGVQGVSAAGSGGLFTVMGLALVAGAIVTGQRLTGAGVSCRAHTLLNTALATAGMYLISGLDADAGLLWTAACLTITGFGLGGALIASGLAAQNGVAEDLVGAATAAMQFARLVGGMLGVAVLGAAMTMRFPARLYEALPGEVGASLPAALLDSLRDSPRSLVDPAAAAELKALFAETGPEGARTAEQLPGAIETALAGAMHDVFLLAAAVGLLSLGAAAFMPGRSDGSA